MIPACPVHPHRNPLYGGMDTGRRDLSAVMAAIAAITADKSSGDVR